MRILNKRREAMVEAVWDQAWHGGGMHIICLSGKDPITMLLDALPGAVKDLGDMWFMRLAHSCERGEAELWFRKPEDFPAGPCELGRCACGFTCLKVDRL